MVASDRQRHFLRARVFRFFPDAAAIAGGGTHAAMGQFARTKFNFLRPIDFFFPFSFYLFLSFPSSFFSSFVFFFFFSVMELRESEELVRRKKEELNRRKGGRGKKVGRDGIFYGECVHGWQGEGIESRTSCRDSTARFSRNSFSPSSFVRETFQPDCVYTRA